MAIGLENPVSIKPVKGIRLSTCYSGIRNIDTADLTLIECASESTISAVYTRNTFCAAPVQLSKQHGTNDVRYLLINAGNANAGTGQKGLDAARQTCQMVAQHGNVEISQVLPFSTGVIGEYLPVVKIESALPYLFSSLDEDNWLQAAYAIMTTDTQPKLVTEQLTLSSGENITITGISKGAGMICPDMATMLAYIAMDVKIEQAQLDQIIKCATDQSFNSISVDGDTSTNDSCVLIATGEAGNAALNERDLNALQDIVTDVFQTLAQAIVRDAEGINKFVTVVVDGGHDRDECKQVAYTIAHSPLVKTALFASDPNWGRILAAIGRSGLQDLDVKSINFSLNGVSIVKNGERDPFYTEEQGSQAMKKGEITLDIQLGRGDAVHTLWTCDLGYDYVRINAEYRT